MSSKRPKTASAMHWFIDNGAKAMVQADGNQSGGEEPFICMVGKGGASGIMPIIPGPHTPQ